MKVITAFSIVLLSFVSVSAQNEQSPIVAKTINYRNWSYKNLSGDGQTDLRAFTQGKKLVMVVYWAPWCPNWRHDVAFVQGLHERYGDKGLAVIGVSNYAKVSEMKNHTSFYKLTFPNVFDSVSTADRLTTEHYQQRTVAGDTRKWGTPWYIFLEPGKLESQGDVIARNVDLVNGELIKDEAEKYIREKLGLGANAIGKIGKNEIEVCDPATNASALNKP